MRVPLSCACTVGNLADPERSAVQKWALEVGDDGAPLCPSEAGADEPARNKKKLRAAKHVTLFFLQLQILAPRPGLEPGTCGLTVRRSTN